MKKTRVVLPGRQRGATLVIALLILVMIMMYGIPAAMDSMQNERMAGNTRQRDLAFQAAEHTLKKVEAWIMLQTASSLGALAPAAANSCGVGGVPDDVDPIPNDGIFPNGECHANDIVYWQSFNWSSNGLNPSGSIDTALVAAQPRYIVERMPDVTVTTPGSPTVTKSYYRVTARGVGKDSNAAVILQTMYEFTN